MLDNAADRVTEATIAASDAATDMLVTPATTGTIRHETVPLANVATPASVLSGAYVAFASGLTVLAKSILLAPKTS
jgi:hypothetical protein